MMRANKPFLQTIRLLPTAYCLLLLFTTGCVRRSLTIRTAPPGAQVYVNDQQLKGDSPVTYDFLWYGWYRVRILKAGYETLEDHRELLAPMHLWIPFDLVMELLPITVSDVREWSYTLTPRKELPVPSPPETAPSEAPTPPAGDTP
jgi:hypothetical protein